MGGRPRDDAVTAASGARPSTTLGAVGSAVNGRGWLLTIEGPEGAGKTSQAERLRRAVEDAGFAVVLTREPGGTVLGEWIREIVLDARAAHEPRTDALLFNAARAQLVAEVISPALDRGSLVISTRFADSTLAYQGYGAGVPLDDLRAVEAAATAGLKPDLTILLDVPAEVGLARKSSERTRFETAFPADFHRRVRDGFLALAAAEPDRFAVVDAARSEPEVAQAVLQAAARLPALSALAAPSEPGMSRPPGDPAARGEPERAHLRIHR